VTGKSTTSEIRNKNVSSLSLADQHESTARHLPQTRKEIAAAAETAALR